MAGGFVAFAPLTLGHKFQKSFVSQVVHLLHFRLYPGYLGLLDKTLLMRAVDSQPEKPEFLAAHAEALLIPITNKINQSDSPLSTPSDGATLSAVIAEFDRARTGFEKSGRPKKAAKVQLAIGATLMAQGKFDLAIQRLHPLSLASDPDPELWRNLGTAYLSAGKPSEAVAPLERAVELGERLNEPQLLLTAYMVSGNADRARSFAEARSAGGITRDSLQWHLRKAEALRAMRKWTEAQKVLRRKILT
jgi:tetratricopeptide (TPR) repeat protein